MVHPAIIQYFKWALGPVLAGYARGFAGKLLEIEKQNRESLVEVAVAGPLPVAKRDRFQQGPQQKMGFTVIDEEPENGRSGARVVDLEIQDQVGIGRIPRHLEEAGGLESRIKLIVCTILTAAIERIGGAGIGKEDLFGSEDGWRDGAWRGGGGLLGKADKRRTKSETDDQSESKTDAAQVKYLLRTKIHSFRQLRQPENVASKAATEKAGGSLATPDSPFESKMRSQATFRPHPGMGS